MASLQSSRWVPRIRLHILSPLHVSLGPNLPTYKRTPVLWTPTRPNGLTNSITSAKSSSLGQATSTGTWVRTSTHLAGDEREPNPRPGRDLTAPEGHTAGQCGSWAYSARLNCCTVQGALQAICAGASAPSWDQQGWCQLAKPSQSAERLSHSWRLLASMSRLFCGCLHSRRTISAPPPPPSCSGWSSGYQPERGGWGGAREVRSLESQAPTRVTCTLRSSGFSL